MLTLFHDFASPTSAIAVARLQRLADEGLPVAFAGFDVTGVDVALPPGLDVLADLDRLAEEAAVEGIVLRRPAVLPPTARAHVVASVADAAGLGASWRQSCYRAVWADRRDVGDPAVLVDLASAAGLDPAAVRAALDDPALLASVRRRTAERRRDGVGGVPTLLAHRTLVPGLLTEADLRALAV